MYRSAILLTDSQLAEKKELDHRSSPNHSRLKRSLDERGYDSDEEVDEADKRMREMNLQ